MRLFLRPKCGRPRVYVHQGFIWACFTRSPVLQHANVFFITTIPTYNFNNEQQGHTIQSMGQFSWCVKIHILLSETYILKSREIVETNSMWYDTRSPVKLPAYLGIWRNLSVDNADSRRSNMADSSIISSKENFEGNECHGVCVEWPVLPTGWYMYVAPIHSFDLSVIPHLLLATLVCRWPE